ncbi:hypothetical protein HDU76_002240, partial [Blyttiomyces sp. JEL0837]
LKKRLPVSAKGMPCTAHRILLSALLIATKFLQDNPIKNKSFWMANIPHHIRLLFSLQEVNLMERQLLGLLEFDVVVSEAEIVEALIECGVSVSLPTASGEMVEPRFVVEGGDGVVVGVVGANVYNGRKVGAARRVNTGHMSLPVGSWESLPMTATTSSASSAFVVSSNGFEQRYQKQQLVGRRQSLQCQPQSQQPRLPLQRQSHIPIPSTSLKTQVSQPQSTTTQTITPDASPLAVVVPNILSVPPPKPIRTSTSSLSLSLSLARSNLQQQQQQQTMSTCTSTSSVNSFHSCDDTMVMSTSMIASPIDSACSVSSSNSAMLSSSTNGKKVGNTGDLMDIDQTPLNMKGTSGIPIPIRNGGVGASGVVEPITPPSSLSLQKGNKIGIGKGSQSSQQQQSQQQSHVMFFPWLSSPAYVFAVQNQGQQGSGASGSGSPGMVGVRGRWSLLGA